MAPKLTVDGTKYTFFVPEGGYRPHIHRHGEPWVVVDQGCNAVLALMYEADHAQTTLTKIEEHLDASTCAPINPEVIRALIAAYRRGE